MVIPKIADNPKKNWTKVWTFAGDPSKSGKNGAFLGIRRQQRAARRPGNLPKPEGGPANKRPADHAQEVRLATGAGTAVRKEVKEQGDGSTVFGVNAVLLFKKKQGSRLLTGCPVFFKNDLFWSKRSRLRATRPSRLRNTFLHLKPQARVSCRAQRSI